MSFRIALGLEDLQKELLAIGEAGPRILARSLDRAATAGKTAMARAIAEDTGIANKNVTREISIDKAGLRSKVDPRIVVSIKGRRLPLIAFGARGPEPSKGKGRGVSYKLPTGRGRAPGAFIATMPGGGHRGVFVRVGALARGAQGPGFSQKRSRGAWGPNLPIRELLGPSLPHVFEKKIDVFETAAQLSLTKNLIHELGREVEKQTGAE